ncbi:Ankyrin-3 [Lasiodiplodia theobromae]|uniref:Ankyrin-3 n=1 Tax=Lasiodiplodia theobromae TaxID=45133 RepID=A0A5N5D2A5_9PEZI|nr:Ankyrin-3 [Lasiodiplodia theobromae]
MGIYEDARDGTLDASALNEYVRKDPNLLNNPDPEEGLTPLAVASIKGHVEVVDLLLKKCARADVTSQIGETTLLLATRNRIMNRSRIVQLLLQKTPPCFIDATCPDAKNNTPLMFAIKHRDLDSIRLLRSAGACLTLRNNDDFNAKDLAKQTGDNAIERALYPDNEHSDLFKLARLVLDLLVFIITWVNQVTGAICRMYNLDPEMNQVIKQLVISPTCEPNRCPNQANATSPCNLSDDDISVDDDSSPEDDVQELRSNVDRIVKDTALGTFFEGEEEYMEQKDLVERITKITTRILPKGEGVVLRFINQDVGDSSNLTAVEIGKKLAEMSPVTNSGHSEIGTNLRSKILKPLVYDKLKERSLKRPLLISVITDGRPNNEDTSTLANVILECGKNLEADGYRREHRLDEKFAKFHDNKRDIDQWLIETLSKPIEDAEQ